MKIIMPWNNLGCLGIRWGGFRYMDIFWKPFFGIYYHTRGRRYWINIPKMRVVRKEEW